MRHSRQVVVCTKDKSGTESSCCRSSFTCRQLHRILAWTVSSEFGVIKEKISELSAVGIKLDKDIKLAIILNGFSEEYRYLVVNMEKQETVDFDELSAQLIEEKHLIKSNRSNDGGSKLAWMARSKQSGRVHGSNGRNCRDAECHYCGQRGHFKLDCLVRKFREEKDGENVVKHQSKGARASIST
jgi:gag-polypeptide of LTR copia-type